MIRVGFHTEAQVLIVEGHDVFPARSLSIHDTGDGYLELWSLAGRSERRAHWSEYGSLAQETFATEAETIAYLRAEFAKPEQRGDAYAVDVAITEPGQTRIPLSIPPTQPNTLRLEINGVTYRAPEIAASSVAVEWLSPAFSLQPTDRVTVVYS